MSHLDEGQIHALLDDELDESERRTVEEHLKGCVACREAVEVAKHFLAEADRLVGSLEVPPAIRSAALGTNQPARRVPLLQRYQWAAWAATVVLAVGIGYYGSDRPTARPAATGSADKGAVADDKLSSPKPESPVAGVASQAPAPSSAPAMKQKAANEIVTPTQKAPALERAADAEEKDEARRAADSRDSSIASKLDLQPGMVAPDRNEQPAAQGVRKDKPAEPAGRLAEVPMPPPRTLNSEIHDPPFQRTTLEQAVGVLGGSVLLIDGMEPVEVQTGPGSSLLGADPARAVVRVIYLDPPGRQLWLDQQRMAEKEVTGAVESAQQVERFLPGDTLFVREGVGASTLRWVSQTSFRLALTGYLPEDSLRALSRRVR